VDVVILTQAHCAFCQDAQRILERLAREYVLTVRNVDLNSAEGQALAQAGGVLLPPGIVIDGQAVSHGRPSERRLRRELDRMAASR